MGKYRKGGDLTGDELIKNLKNPEERLKKIFSNIDLKKLEVAYKKPKRAKMSREEILEKIKSFNESEGKK